VKIKELMTTDVITCTPSTPIMEVAKHMKNNDIGSVPVVDNNQLVGLVTDRDVIVRCIALGLDPNKTQAQDCMTKNPVTVTPETDAHEAADLMSSEQVRRLPVVKDGKLVGICVLGDLAVMSVHVDEAGDALSGISEQSRVH
jgi:CBS domain-containing protein